ncbi:MAG: hypothetical protein HOC71_19565 [Candidatus Latescibacteria bacterium]|nr:hypothetical protein [Candidatus Latescibacterota bacterium]
MKTKAVSIVLTWIFLVCLVSVFIGCEELTGSKGDDGADGADGADGTALCGTCHSISTEIVAKQAQYQASTHATGGNSERGGSASCAVCHSSEGFRLSIAGEDAVGIDNPTQPNCRTCHNIHTNYDETDYDVVVTGSVEITTSMGDATETVDFGKGSLCASCHRSRPYGYTLAVGGGDYEVTSSRFGPHHGPQGNILAGFGGYEVSGSMSYTNSAHTTMVTEGCTTCHMAAPYGVQAGGHSMKMGYDYHDELVPNTAGCESCHSDIESFDIGDTQTEVEELLEELAALLIEAGIMKEAGGSAVTGTYSSDIAGARMNYQMCLEDRSNGVHNPKYVKALLTNSIEALQ